MEINLLVALRIKELRTSQGITAEYVAKELKLAKSNYSMLENGHVEIKVAVIYALADILKVPVEAIFAVPRPGTSITTTQGEHAINATQVNHYHQLASDLERAAEISLKAAAIIKKRL